MAEQVKIEEVVTTIMYGLSQVIAAEAKSEQERMNEAQQVLYMTLCHMQMYVEETALSTQLDNSAEWVRLFLATMVIRGCTEKTVESYRQEYTTFFGTINKAIPDITTGDIRGVSGTLQAGQTQQGRNDQQQDSYVAGTVYMVDGGRVHRPKPYVTN